MPVVLSDLVGLLDSDHEGRDVVNLEKVEFGVAELRSDAEIRKIARDQLHASLPGNIGYWNSSQPLLLDALMFAARHLKRLHAIKQSVQYPWALLLTPSKEALTAAYIEDEPLCCEHHRGQSRPDDSTRSWSRQIYHCYCPSIEHVQALLAALHCLSSFADSREHALLRGMHYAYNGTLPSLIMLNGYLDDSSLRPEVADYSLALLSNTLSFTKSISDANWATAIILSKQDNCSDSDGLPETTIRLSSTGQRGASSRDPYLLQTTGGSIASAVHQLNPNTFEVPNTDTGCTLFVWEDDAKTAAAERGVELKYPKLANKTAPSYSNRPRGAVEANTLAPAPVHKTQPPTNYEFEDNEEAPVGGRQSGAKEALRSIKKARVNYSDESTDDELYMEQGNAIDWEAAEKTVAAVEASQPTSSTKEGPPKANFVNPFIKDVESISDRSQVNPTSSTLPIPNSNNYRSSTPPRSPQFSSHYAQYGYALPHSDDVRPNVAKTGFLPNGLITPQTTPQKPTNKRHLDTSPHTEGAIVIDEVSSQDASLSIHPHLTSLNAHLHHRFEQHPWPSTPMMDPEVLAATLLPTLGSLSPSVSLPMLMVHPPDSPSMDKGPALPQSARLKSPPTVHHATNISMHWMGQRSREELSNLVLAAEIGNSLLQANATLRQQYKQLKAEQASKSSSELVSSPTTPAPEPHCLTRSNTGHLYDASEDTDTLSIGTSPRSPVPKTTRHAMIEILQLEKTDLQSALAQTVAEHEEQEHRANEAIRDLQDELLHTRLELEQTALRLHEVEAESERYRHSHQQKLAGVPAAISSQLNTYAMQQEDSEEIIQNCGSCESDSLLQNENALQATQIKILQDKLRDALVELQTIPIMQLMLKQTEEALTELKTAYNAQCEVIEELNTAMSEHNELKKARSLASMTDCSVVSSPATFEFEHSQDTLHRLNERFVTNGKRKASRRMTLLKEMEMEWLKQFRGDDDSEHSNLGQSSSEFDQDQERYVAVSTSRPRSWWMRPMVYILELYLRWCKFGLILFFSLSIALYRGPKWLEKLHLS
ncbi:hypothetical protein BZG36_01545 [Bifiguratus adelaidae]|uniref:Uncharacterized protein n=1 Tax=Bifiguratus adelaidae TaxID=1938954 RepID=A0A261Y3W1_9FUNG|nr:hypothetical protein BZG36_01545 [Bifiguratus adelaidae]